MSLQEEQAAVPQAGSITVNFDRLAAHYDRTFTANLSARLQRNRTWLRMEQHFPSGCNLLEMSCGTGEDALHLAALGYCVEAYDASKGMIEEATRRAASQQSLGSARFGVMPFEHMESVRGRNFDAGLSNFGGLNCVPDLRGAFRGFASALRPGAPLLVCFIGRYCLWEIAWPLLRGRWKETVRRARGNNQVSGATVFYPSVREIRRAYHPWFVERSVEGLAILLPCYGRVEPFLPYPRLLRGLDAIDSVIGRWHLVRSLGDNTLFVLERNDVESDAG